MDTSFYTAARGARTMQERMDVISNNLANVNTKGYKTKDAKFQDLMYYNIRGREGKPGKLQAGTGVVQDRTDTDFTPSLLEPTGMPFDFGIKGSEGFFKVQDPVTLQISYTRSANLSMSQRKDGFYLVTDDGKFILNSKNKPLKAIKNKATGKDEPDSMPAVFKFRNTNDMRSVGANEFMPVPKNGQPELARGAEVVQGYLEAGNVDLAEEMAKIVETSRAYSYALKMVTTSDEVEQTINSLR